MTEPAIRLFPLRGIPAVVPGDDLAAQILWSDPERIHVLGLIPQTLLAIEPRTGIVEPRTAATAEDDDLLVLEPFHHRVASRQTTLGSGTGTMKRPPASANRL